MGRIYDTSQWKRLRKLYLSLHPLCEVCSKMDKVTPATQVDHVIAINEGGEPFALDNLMALCSHHHSRKTVLRDGGLGRAPSDESLIKGCSTDGMPVDPQHPWHRGGQQS